jgi:hypothetical protein
MRASAVDENQTYSVVAPGKQDQPREINQPEKV